MPELKHMKSEESTVNPEVQKESPFYAEVAKQKRLNSAREESAPWKKRGPYLSERQWGTVRENYSDSGDAWNYFTHDQAPFFAYASTMDVSNLKASGHSSPLEEGGGRDEE
jgi:hypothetical protein